MNNDKYTCEYGHVDKNYTETRRKDAYDNYNYGMCPTSLGNIPEDIFLNNPLKGICDYNNSNYTNYSNPNISERFTYNPNSYIQYNDIFKKNNTGESMKIRSRQNKEKLYYVRNENEIEHDEQNCIRNNMFEINNTLCKTYQKNDFMKINPNIKRGLKKKPNINEKYNKIKKDVLLTSDLYLKSFHKYYPCNCLNVYKEIYKNTKYEISDLKQVHTDLIYLILKYLYYERILPEANEIKRKINKYFPDCAVLNNNFINICREDPYKKFEIYRSNAYEKDLKKGKIIYKKPFNNENICIYLRGVPRDFFINPNDDNENISLYIPLIFIHIIDRFRIQSSDNNHKGGRYILAETLKHTGPYIFRTMKLGRIIHILQKCIDLNILSYFNNNIIPIFTSMSISKTYISKMHVNQTPALKNHKEQSINLIKNRIKSLLYSYSEDKSKTKGFSLSRLPLIYKNVYKENINIDQIGYSKLTEFINNEMSDICFISTQHKFQCILLPVMEDEQKHRDKNSKLKKEIEIKKSLDYIKKYQWERCITFLHTLHCLKSKHTNFELEYSIPSNNSIDELINDPFFCDNINLVSKESTPPLLLPLNVFNLPSSYDMYNSYFKSNSYYSKDENDDASAIQFLDTSQNKFDIICDFQKYENTNISIEEPININSMYVHSPSSYDVFNSLFNDNTVNHCAE
ncbi:hypothetical protein YYC_05772 [Plasmodium yoelii 17X]|nr:OST-HTH associated domain protein, putative [Plasmodium yoelii]ETB56342.1 hypothetical protein YYC_05772 [Plasmodium yoelii 17X]CDU19686.1 conserved Plasmodium protein, unknown function [Plasmodium yoelii]VTZ80443.1 OST-HTH associated domain protein, putative [Plasmodium yoelii]|eukprot:XP_022813487.1 OST-HTH associated domain protein, putative [Plasmodium yoelii]